MAALEPAEKREDGASEEPQATQAAPDTQQQSEQPAAQAFDFGERRKKKKDKKAEHHEDASAQPFVDGSGELFVRGHVYSYEEMLSRIQDLIVKHNPDLAGSKRYTIKPPQVVRVGSKKVAWINFKDICGIMHRPSEHVLHFVLAELAALAASYCLPHLKCTNTATQQFACEVHIHPKSAALHANAAGTEGSIAGDGQLVLKGNLTVKNSGGRPLDADTWVVVTADGGSGI
ncbi:hypothetical protein Efla_007056 [Eimeria flavescens]